MLEAYIQLLQTEGCVTCNIDPIIGHLTCKTFTYRGIPIEFRKHLMADSTYVLHHSISRGWQPYSPMSHTYTLNTVGKTLPTIYVDI